jgi:O-methyltransferase/8-demethyl-8-(2,3-dimethoxy-alpha-L-rhamnosyl)tetracenomycin-C 4'-O-methyltransferase
LRLDGDMYESTIEALDALYHKVSYGGFVIVDDYFLPACAKAVSDFRERYGIKSPILPIDGWGTYWRVDHKPIR